MRLNIAERLSAYLLNYDADCIIAREMRFSDWQFLFDSQINEC